MKKHFYNIITGKYEPTKGVINTGKEVMK